MGDYHIGNRNILLWSHQSPRLVMFLTILLPDPLLSLSHGAAPTSAPKTSIPLPKKWCELAHSFLLSKQATQGSGHNTKFAGGQEVFGQPSQTRGHTATLDTHLQRGKKQTEDVAWLPLRWLAHIKINPYAYNKFLPKLRWPKPCEADCRIHPSLEQL